MDNLLYHPELHNETVVEKEIITYDVITEEDADEVARLYAEHLNSGDSVEEHVKEGIKSPDFIGFKAVCNGKIVGMLTGRGGVDFTYPHPELEERLSKYWEGKKVYTPDSVVVLKEYRHHNIFNELGARLVPTIYERGYEILLTELWIYPNGNVPAEATVRHWGELVHKEDIPMFYKDNEKYGIICPICGKTCTCGARIIIMDVDGDIKPEE